MSLAENENPGASNNTLDAKAILGVELIPFNCDRLEIMVAVNAVIPNVIIKATAVEPNTMGFTIGPPSMKARATAGGTPLHQLSDDRNDCTLAHGKQKGPGPPR